ncbi:IS6 family transposase [Dactylosporangium siamense]|uniref:IS6 family transposase n=1 Tax=Dactylosporangium siamense TaxID=685454 RepID=UPI0023B22B51|nr:IS6 family transposase [Dactylosporangium siamense]
MPPKSAFAGFRFPPEIIAVAVRWYLRFNLSYRDVEELLLERGMEVDYVTVFRWVQRFTPLFADVARFCRHSPGDRWHVDETYVKVNGFWRYVYRAVDQYGQVIDVLVSARRDADAARRFFRRALSVLKVTPTEVVNDAASVYPGVLDELRRAVQVRGGAAVAGAGWRRVGFGAGGEDAFDGAVGRVPDRDRSAAGGFQPCRGGFVGQAEDTLGGAEPEQGVDLEQPGDDLLAGGADLGGLRGALRVRRGCRRAGCIGLTRVIRSCRLGGDPPSNDFTARDEFNRLYDLYMGSDIPVAPVTRVAAYVDALLDRYPDLGTGDRWDSPWAAGPLINEARGPLIYFAMVWSRCEETSEFAARLAEEHGLNCYDPQWNQLRTPFRESWTFELASEHRRPFRDPDADLVRRVLVHLSSGNRYAVLTRADGRYVKVGLGEQAGRFALEQQDGTVELTEVDDVVRAFVGFLEERVS